MKVLIHTLLALPLLAILILGAGLSLYGAMHWSWYVLAGGWLGMIALVETAISMDYTTDD